MNKIDKRTGQVFPSVLKVDAVRALLALPDSRSQGHAKQLQSELMVAQTDQSRDWILNLDVHSVADLGAFEDFYWYEEGADEGEGEPHQRPLEWFHRAADIIHESVMVDDEIWSALNRIFDDAIAQADRELGFKEDTE